MIRSLVVFFFAIGASVVTAQTTTPPVTVKQQPVSDAVDDKPEGRKNRDEAPRAPTTDLDSKGEVSHPNHEQQGNAAEHDGINWTAVAALATVLFGGGGLYYLRRQIVALEKSNEQTREHNERTLAATQESNRITQESNQLTRDAMIAASRAHVALKGLPTFGLVANVPRAITFTIRNSGQSTARSITMFGGFEVGTNELMVPLQGAVQKLSMAFKPTSVAVLPPGGSLDSMDAELLTLTDEQVEHLGKGKLFLFFSLEIKYDDGFGEKRTTRYLIVHEGRGQDFKYCGTGNWAD